MKTIKFSPQTGATRLFHSFNLAQEWFPNAQFVTRPTDFLRINNYKGEFIPLPYQYNAMFGWGAKRLLRLDENTYFNQDKEILVAPHSFHQLDESEQLDMLYKLAWSIGNLVLRPPRSTHPDSAPSAQAVLKQGFVVDLDKAKTASTIKELPKQARCIAQGLFTNKYDFYTEAEMRAFMLELVASRTLKTQQDPWRILRYYRKALADHGVLVYQEV